MGKYRRKYRNLTIDKFLKANDLSNENELGNQNVQNNRKKKDEKIEANFNEKESLIVRTKILKERENELKKKVKELQNKIVENQDTLSEEDKKNLKNCLLQYINSFKQWKELKKYLNQQKNNPDLISLNSQLLISIQKRKENINDFCRKLSSSYKLMTKPINSIFVEKVYRDNKLMELADITKNQRKLEIRKLFEKASDEINKKYLKKLESLGLTIEPNNLGAFIPDWNV